MDNATLPTMTNETSVSLPCGMDKWFHSANILNIVLYGLTCVFGVTGNGLVIFITGFRMKKTFTTVFFLNLAIADFMVTSFLIMPIAYAFEFSPKRMPTLLDKEMCQFISTIRFLNLYSSVLFLMVISIGRYISVRYPVWSRNHQTAQLASWVALGVWILSLGLSCAFLFSDRGWRIPFPTVSKNRVICIANYATVHTFMRITSLFLFLSHVILSFMLPFIVMVSCYGATIYTLRKSQFAQSGKPFKAMTAVTVAFFVCCFPINLIVFIAEPSLQFLEELKCALFCFYAVTYFISDWLAYFNSCLNPILYVFIGHNYRESLRCSLLSALENAFREEKSPGRTKTKDNSPAMIESQNL